MSLPFVSGTTFGIVKLFCDIFFPVTFWNFKMFTAFGCHSIEHLSWGTPTFTRDVAFSRHTTNMVWQSFVYKAGGGRHVKEREIWTCHWEIFKLWREININAWSLQVRKHRIFPFWGWFWLWHKQKPTHYDFTTDKVCNSLRIPVLIDTCAMRR